MAVAPSVMAQGAKPHRLSLAKQKSPVVVASQLVVPHAQFSLLSAVPSVTVHVRAVLQRSLLDVSQKSPVADVQAPEVPQTQGAGLAVTPSPWAQAGPVKDPTMKLLEVLHWLSGL